MKKTGKREVALGCLCYCAGLGGYVAASGSPSGLAVLQIWLPAAFLFAGGAFGLDAWSKQLGGGGKQE